MKNIAVSGLVFMVFKSLSNWMDEKNSSYYKSSKTKIYDDFSTYAMSEKGVLSRANAKEFYEFAKSKTGRKFSILEIGVGNGAFASGFLDEISKLDRQNKTEISNFISYTLADFSKTILDGAMKNLNKQNAAGKTNISSILLDASNLDSASLGAEKFDLIRCNELFSDLPANLYLNEGGQLHQALLDEKMKPKITPLPLAELTDFEKKSLFAMPEGFLIPLNKPALDAISFFSNHLAEGGWMDIFDYGFYFKTDFDVPAEMWNLSIVREFGGQWTVDMNFLYLSASLSSMGRKTNVQAQKTYAEKIIGKKLSLSDEEGLDYSDEISEFEEEDFFYHMRVEL